MPLSDRDYMRRPSVSGGGPGRYGIPRGFNLNAIWIIIGINFLLFIVTSFSIDAFVALGLVPAYFTDRPWTILTNMFVHAGFGHLFGNMITLYFFGTFLSRLVGQNKFLLLYFGGGILGNIFYLWLGEPISIAVGASGAVFALAGALVVMVPKMRVLLYFIVPLPLWVAVLGGFLILSLLPSVAWEAHLGGLMAGLVAGYIFKMEFKKRERTTTSVRFF